MLSILVFVPAAVAASAPAAALERKTVSLAQANRLADAAITSCRAIGREAVVAIVDRGGNLVSLQRGDDVGPHNTLAAQRKAFTALSTKTTTAALAQRATTDPTSRNLVTVPELLLLGGGVPLTVDGDVIGGIGVAGSGGAANDERCAAQAVAQVLTSGARTPVSGGAQPGGRTACSRDDPQGRITPGLFPGRGLVAGGDFDRSYAAISPADLLIAGKVSEDRRILLARLVAGEVGQVSPKLVASARLRTVRPFATYPQPCWISQVIAVPTVGHSAYLRSV